MLVSMFWGMATIEFMGRNIWSPGLTDPVNEDLDEDSPSMSIEANDCLRDSGKSSEVGVKHWSHVVQLDAEELNEESKELPIEIEPQLERLLDDRCFLFSGDGVISMFLIIALLSLTYCTKSCVSPC